MARKPLTKDKLDKIVGREQTLVDVNDLRTDGGTQPRAEFDEETAAEYAERMEVRKDSIVIDPDGEPWQRLVVFYDGETYWLADGFHRVGAARIAKIKQFQAEVRQGTHREAVIWSLGANAKHGKRRTNRDKRRVVKKALRDEDLRTQSDREIARICKVSQPFVSSLRKSLEELDDYEAPRYVKGRDGKKYDREALTSRGDNASHSPQGGTSHDGKVKKRTAEGTVIELAGPERIDTGDIDFRAGDFRRVLESEKPRSFDVVFTRGTQNPNRLDLWNEIASHANRLLADDGVFMVFVPAMMFPDVHTIITRRKFQWSHDVCTRWLGGDVEWGHLSIYTRDGRSLGVASHIEASPDFGGHNYITRHILRDVAGPGARLVDPMAGSLCAPIAIGAAREGLDVIAVEEDTKILREAKIMAANVLEGGK